MWIHSDWALMDEEKRQDYITVSGKVNNPTVHKVPPGLIAKAIRPIGPTKDRIAAQFWCCQEVYF